MLSILNQKSNYLSQIIRLPELRSHNNADRLQCLNWQGNNIITGLTAHANDLYVYVPVGATINKEFISWCNGFEDTMCNADGKTKGYFDKHARVRAIRLRGENSGGYVFPVQELETWLFRKGIRVNLYEFEGQEFDTIGNILFCDKYVVRSQGNAVANKQKCKVREKRFNKVIEENFHFHDSTPHLGRNIHIVNPDTVIAITTKYHGTSFGVQRILCRKKMNWWQRLINKFTPLDIKYYDVVWHSRTVIKNNYENNQPGFYSVDLWGEAAKAYQDKLTEGLCVFGEIVGYIPKGQKMIQKSYDYGCNEGEFQSLVYRMNYTSPSGYIYEFTWPQIKSWCEDNGFTYVRELYYGKAGDLFPDLNPDHHWNQNFLDRLQSKYLEHDCDLCKNRLPAEGITVRIDDGRSWRIFKLKSERFRQRESKLQDEGEEDLEELQVDSINETVNP